MELRWTEEAAEDLEHITGYLFENAPGRAAEFVREIYNAPSALLAFPYRGRPGKKGNARGSCFLRFLTLWSTKSPGMSSILPVSCTARRSGLKKSAYRKMPVCPRE